MDRRTQARYRVGMIVIAALVLGAAIGWFRAARMGGARADKLEYAAAHAMGLAVLALFLTVFLTRMS